MWVDTHAHLDMDAFAGDLDDVLVRAAEAGVDKIITIGIDLASSRKAVALAECHPNVWASVGIHPHEAAKATEADFEALIGLLAHPRCVALGETGLDYHYDFSPRDVQRTVFKTQLRLAQALRKPLVIHVREAMAEALQIIDDCGPGPWRGVFHCFGGDENDVPHVVERGFHVGFTGVVSFKNFGKAEAVRRVPLSRLLVETDAPYMAPVPFRGKRCEPAHAAQTGEVLAGLLDVDAATLAERTTANAETLFGLGPR